MKVYRTTVHTGADWATHYDARQSEAVATARELAEVYGAGAVRCDLVEVPPGRDGMAAALNLAGANPMNWDGEPVAWRRRGG